MKERPILFTPHLVNEVRAGRKTETRRLVRVGAGQLVHAGWPCSGREWPGSPGCTAPSVGQHHVHLEMSPGARHQHFANLRSTYGTQGDRLWIRTTWATAKGLDKVRPSLITHSPKVWYLADGEPLGPELLRGRWRPSIHMPRWACRDVVEVEAVRIEPLHKIDDKGALAEGVDRTNTSIPGYALERFRRLWDEINGKRAPWESNPWVWVVSFRRLPLERG